MSMASSSSSPGPITVLSSPTKYDVFLSFRGEDTRDNFTSHLYEALCRKEIETYIDDRLNRGDDISHSLMETIEESMIYVIIFPKNYASSPWCLDELVKILECKERYGRIVMPVFCYVDPSVVRHQSGSYADAFVKHENRFNNNMDKVMRWKDALTEAANLSGWESLKIRPESALIKKIVGHISKTLSRMSLSTSELNGLVGVEKHIAVIESLLDIHPEFLHCEALNGVRIIGIWGIGGIGKTTIADALFRKHATKFSSSVFIANVQEEIERHGVNHIQSKYISMILEEEDLQSDFSNIRSSYMKDRLRRARVLLILDNVNNPGQIKDLVGGHDWFGSGSRIILTTRDKQVLKNAEVDEIYEVKEMNFLDALQLFCMNAFKQNHPKDDYKELSETMVDYSRGVPLALKVLGSSLCQKSKQEWESAVRKLQKAPNREIFNVLKLSYDGLDEEEKNIFLDIACLYRGQDMNSVKQTLDGCGFSADFGMSILIDRGLIYILKEKIVMHDLIEEMGQEIVRQISPMEPGKRSQLWKHEDIYPLLRKNTGTEAVQCMFLNLCRIKKIDLEPTTFKMMNNLRMLQFYKSNLNEHSKVYISRGLDYLPDELRFLCWDEYPLKDFPLSFCPENLVKLDMRESHLEELWDENQHLPHLRSINLSGSKQLTRIIDLSQAPNIEEVILSYCINLVEVSSSKLLNKLNRLWLDGWIELKRVAVLSNILSTSSGLVVLYNCINLEELVISNTSLEYSIATYTPQIDGMGMPTWRILKSSSMPERGIKEKPKAPPKWMPPPPPPVPKAPPPICFDRAEPMDIEEYDEPMDNIHLIRLKLLASCIDLSHCKSLTHLPINLFQLGGLTKLYLARCSMLGGLPPITKPMENLKVLILKETPIRQLPLFLENLIGLEELSMCRCENLMSIPETIGSLSKLTKLDLRYCESLEELPSSIFKLKVARLDLRHCSMLKKFPEILERNESLMHLCLLETGIKEIPSSLENLIGLQSLCLDKCRDLEFVPDSISNMSHLKELSFSFCGSLPEIPNNIGCLSLIRELSLRGCESIVSLPASIAHLLSLKMLDLSDCRRFQTLPELPPFLQELLAYDCTSVKSVSSSGFQLSQDSEENKFEFQLTNCHELEPSGVSNIVADVQLRFRKDDPYTSAFFCFPGNEIPNWFPYRNKRNWISTEESSDWCNDKFFGFAVCVVFASKSRLDKCSISYGFSFWTDHMYEHKFPVKEMTYYHNWKGKGRYLERDHLFLWNYNIRKFGKCNSSGSFEFSICNGVDIIEVKECGLCPIYTNEGNREYDNNAVEYPLPPGMRTLKMTSWHDLLVAKTQRK